MKSLDHNRPTPRPSANANWPPPHPVRSIDPNHWLSRAARGHTWNGEAAIRRRHTH
jgi:hypothetical protein